MHKNRRKIPMNCVSGGRLLLSEFPKDCGTWDNKAMRNSKTISAEARAELVKRLQDGNEHEIRAYIAALQRHIAKYAQPLQAGRKVIDDAMKAASLTDLLHESREQ
jgi:hypothetical protein